MKPRVLIVGDRRKDGVSEAVAAHLPKLETKLDILAVDLDRQADLAAAEADLILVFGGDGSILHVARRLGPNPIPVLGVNYGSFGFLADLEPEEVDEGIDRWLSGACPISERRRLAVTHRRNGSVILETFAFNDIVVARRALGGMVDVDVGIDGTPAVTYSGDGLIVATASGSTAHSLAAGGPLVEPTTDAVLLVPIAPHALSARPLVIRSEHEIQLSVKSRRRLGEMSVDGTQAQVLDPGDVLEIRDANMPLRLVHASGNSFYDALRRKLGWRGRSNWGRKGSEAWEERPESTRP